MSNTYVSPPVQATQKAAPKASFKVLFNRCVRIVAAIWTMIFCLIATANKSSLYSIYAVLVVCVLYAISLFGKKSKLLFVAAALFHGGGIYSTIKDIGVTMRDIYRATYYFSGSGIARIFVANFLNELSTITFVVLAAALLFPQHGRYRRFVKKVWFLPAAILLGAQLLVLGLVSPVLDDVFVRAFCYYFLISYCIAYSVETKLEKQAVAQEEFTTEPVAGASTVICANCGNKVSTGTKFCIACGQKVDAPKPVSSAAPVAAPQQTYTAANAPAAPTMQEGDAIVALRGYKDLLDSGVISQEEFDSKKKQLLGI